jgi:hypothetical protein
MDKSVKLIFDAETQGRKGRSGFFFNAKSPRSEGAKGVV